MIANISHKGLRLFPMSQLPNSDGFRAIAVGKDDTRHRVEVVKGADGLHRLDGAVLSEMVGWTNEQ